MPILVLKLKVVFSNDAVVNTAVLRATDGPGTPNFAVQLYREEVPLAAVITSFKGFTKYASTTVLEEVNAPAALVVPLTIFKEAEIAFVVSKILPAAVKKIESPRFNESLVCFKLLTEKMVGGVTAGNVSVFSQATSKMPDVIVRSAKIFFI